MCYETCQESCIASGIRLNLFQSLVPENEKIHALKKVYCQIIIWNPLYISISNCKKKKNSLLNGFIVHSLFGICNQHDKNENRGGNLNPDSHEVL